MIEDRDWYTLRQAAKRVDRSRRTMHRWKRHGLPVTMVGGVNYVAHQDLMEWWRARLLGNPLLQRHKARLKRLEAERERVHA